MYIHDAIHNEISPQVLFESKKYVEELKKKKINIWLLIHQIRELVKSAKTFTKGSFIWFSSRPYQYSLKVDVEKREVDAACSLCAHQIISSCRFKVLNLNNDATVEIEETDYHYIKKHTIFFEDPTELCRVFDYIGTCSSDSSDTFSISEDE